MERWLEFVTKVLWAQVVLETFTAVGCIGSVTAISIILIPRGWWLALGLPLYGIAMIILLYIIYCHHRKFLERVFSINREMFFHKSTKINEK